MIASSVIRGMLIGALCYAFFTCYDTAMKYLSLHNPVYLCMTGAFITALLCIVLRAKCGRKGDADASLQVKSWKLHLLRGGLVLVAQLLFYMAIPHIPLTEFYITIFIIPIIVAFMAVPFLSEKITTSLMLALLASFSGILLALLPQGSGSGLNVWHVITLIGSFVNAGSIIVLRKMMAHGESPTAASFTTTLMLALGAGVVAAFQFQMPDMQDVLLIALAGVLYAGANLAMPVAYSLAPASLVAPTAFLQLIYGAISGFLVFHFAPPVWTYLGGAVVILANLYLLYEQHRAHIAVK